TYARARRRCGFTLVEVAVCASMLVMLFTMVGEMIVQMRRHARANEEQAALLRTVENALEELTARPWGEIDEAAIAAIKLSDEAERRWPVARLTGQVRNSNDPAPAKRVTLSLSTGSASMASSLKLTTWVFQTPAR